jgi:hypothetical protein
MEVVDQASGADFFNRVNLQGQLLRYVQISLNECVRITYCRPIYQPEFLVQQIGQRYVDRAT